MATATLLTEAPVVALSSSTREAMLVTQRAWAATPIRERLAILRAARHAIAARPEPFLDAISPNLNRSRADTLSAEILPLLDACRFLERRAEEVLAPRRLGAKGRPFWLAGVHSRVERVPYGVVLLIAPFNYPLLLAGVQALQALAAGNTVVWKPGLGGQAVALLLAKVLAESGLPTGLLEITGESVADAEQALARHPDKIVFTGSAQAGCSVAHAAAESGTPMTAELSGSDAVIALPSADPARLLDALCFGMRLNGSATCMAPRRLILVGEAHARLPAQLAARFQQIRPVPLPAFTRTQLQVQLREAEAQGATIHGNAFTPAVKPLLIDHATPEMRIAQADLFAPVLSVLHVPDAAAVVEADRACPYGLTVAVFGEKNEALALGSQLVAGTLLVNDLIVPTVDPRLPFGGRRGSGYGVTRGAEGLLEMTAVRTVSVRTGRSRRHYEEAGAEHEALFTGVLSFSHAGTWSQRLTGLQRMITAGKKLGKRSNQQESST